uniref:Uncharacterized protein n=1 Tax=Rhizophora mucronata TaxID=61149 RepID=A0A2P2NUX5_RHIMU
MPWILRIAVAVRNRRVVVVTRSMIRGLNQMCRLS